MILLVFLMLEVLFINIIMIGEIGLGKFFFLRIFIIVLMSNIDIKDNYRVGLKESREFSVIKWVKFYVIFNIFFINILFCFEKEKCFNDIIRYG